MRHICWIAALALVTTAACKKDDKGGAKSQSEKPKSGDSTDPAKPAGGGGGATTPEATNGPSVKLVSAGAEPRQPLRYTPQQGSKDSFEIEMRIGVDAGGMKIDMPAMTMMFDFEVTSTTPDAFELAATLTETKVDAKAAGAMGEAMQAELAKLSGMKMINRMTRRGVLEKADIKLPAGFNPQMAQVMDSMKQSMQQAFAPFPEEPVGVGASWEVAGDIEASGMKLHQKAVFELASLDGTKAGLKVKLEQSAGAQDVNTPGMPAGIKTHLNTLAGGGTGEMSIDLSRAVPRSGSFAMKSDASMTVEQGAQKQTVTAKTTVDVELKAK